MKKHGDIVYVRSKNNYCTWIPVKFRYDPVPCYSYRRTFYCYYKHPKSTQERRWSYADRFYVRGKRRDGYLPNAWNDQQRGDIRTRRSWKNKKIKKQWMKNEI